MAKVKIIAKIRPFIGNEPVDDALSTEGNVISLKDSRNSAQRIQYEEFSACYDDSSNTPSREELFATEVEPLLGRAFEGKTVAILCYGVTSSGKTTTLQGHGEDPGIILRSVESLIKQQSRRASSSYHEHTYQLRYFEIYRDDVYDLLAPRAQSVKLKIHDDKDGRVTIPDLKKHSFTNLTGFKNILTKASKSRHTAATSFNLHSSRSHAILSIDICKALLRNEEPTTSPYVIGNIQFVDLAGSESNKPSADAEKRLIGPKSAKERMGESISINQNLSTLRRVVKELNSNSKVVAYRESPLTRVLKEALGGDSITLLICNIAPGQKWLSQTRQTIEFATDAKSIKSTANAVRQEESKKRFEQLRNTDAAFNHLVEEEVKRRLAAMMDGVPLTTKDVVLPSDIPEVPLVDSPKKRPQPESTNPEVKPEPTEIQIKTEPTTIKLEPIDDTSLETSLCKPQGQKSVPEPMPALDRTFSQLSVIAYEPPRRNRPELARIEEEAMGNFEMDQDHLYAAQQPELSDQLDELQEQHAEPTDPRSLELPAVEHLHAKKVRTIEEERERYRKKLSKGLKQKHEVYLSKDKKVDRGKFARACIVAGKMALDEKGDIEFAITMFEKAISWYPENERLLEETLNLKKRLREERGIPDPVPKAASKGKGVARPLASTRLGNSRDNSTSVSTVNKPRRALFDPEVDGPAIEVRRDEEKEKKNSSSRKPQVPKKVEAVKKGKGSRKGKTRAVMEAAAAAFADSESEQEVSENEIEKSLVIDEEVESPVKKGKGKGKGKAIRGKKRKSADEDDYLEEVIRPPKRTRRPLF